MLETRAAAAIGWSCCNLNVKSFADKIERLVASPTEGIGAIISTYFACFAILNVFVCIHMYNQGLFRTAKTLLTFNLAAIDILTTAMDFNKFFDAARSGLWLLDKDACMGHRKANSVFTTVYLCVLSIMVFVEMFQNSEPQEENGIEFEFACGKDKVSYADMLGKLVACFVYILPLYWSKYTFLVASFSCIKPVPISKMTGIVLIVSWLVIICLIVGSVAIPVYICWVVWQLLLGALGCKAGKNTSEKSQSLEDDKARLKRSKSSKRPTWVLLSLSLVTWLLVVTADIFTDFYAGPAVLNVIPTMVTSIIPICFMKCIVMPV